MKLRKILAVATPILILIISLFLYKIDVSADKGLFNQEDQNSVQKSKQIGPEILNPSLPIRNAGALSSGGWQTLIQMPADSKIDPDEKNLADYDELLRKAKENGSVPVIVSLKFDFVPEGDLTAPARTNQRSEIKQNQEILLNRLSKFRPENVLQFETVPGLAMVVDAKTLEFLKAQPEVQGVSEDRQNEIFLAESTSVVRAPQAWTAGFSGAGQVIAILDSGVDKNHPFLSGKVISEACYSMNSASEGVSSVCPGGVEQSTAANSALPCGVNGCFHGTHVAGIAAGRGTSFSGVAKDANLVAIQVFSRKSNNTITAYNRDLIRGLERVLNLKQSGVNIASANMSLGSSPPPINCNTADGQLTGIIQSLRTSGVATVIASGNEGLTSAISYPACISLAVSVGNSGDGSTCPPGSSYCPGGSLAVLNQVANNSNSSSALNLLAPGQWVTSSMPNGAYDTLGGTSMAAPHVAGAWAILKQRSSTATVDQVLNVLAATGQPITDFRNGIIKPRITIDVALQALGGGQGCTPTSITVGQTVNGSLATSDCVFTGTNRYVDVYSFSGTAGQQIAISMNSTAFDAYLYLVNSSNQILAQDDDGGGGTNSRIPAMSGFFTLPATGTYSIWATSLNPGFTGAYGLTLSGSGGGCPTTPISIGQTINGSLTTTDCLYTGTNRYADLYTFSGSVGQQIAITMNSSAMDTFLYLADSNNQLLAQDDDGGGGTNSRIPTASGFFTLPFTGTYVIHATTYVDAPTHVGAYSLTLSQGTSGLHNRKTAGVFRPSNGITYLRNSNTGGVADINMIYGVTGDKSFAGDWNGNGVDSLGIYRNGVFYLRNSNTTGPADIVFAFGAVGDQPVAGDWNNDGIDTIGVYRPTTGVFMLRNSNSAGAPDLTFVLGNPGDIAIAGDWNGDGVTTTGVFRPTNGIVYLKNTNVSGVADIYLVYGVAGDKPLAGDWDGDGISSVGIYRNGLFYLRNSNTQGVADMVFALGNNGDEPIAGDWDGLL